VPASAGVDSVVSLQAPTARERAKMCRKEARVMGSVVVEPGQGCQV